MSAYPACKLSFLSIWLSFPFNFSPNHTLLFLYQLIYFNHKQKPVWEPEYASLLHFVGDRETELNALEVDDEVCCGKLGFFLLLLLFKWLSFISMLLEGRQKWREWTCSERKGRQKWREWRWRNNRRCVQDNYKIFWCCIYYTSYKGQYASPTHPQYATPICY